ncbi:MAG: hypothetical protein QNJ14_07495 [Woeseiaceae bacterium]|nr:hypothetical protein [Woeseiaceae bacterium]
MRPDVTLFVVLLLGSASAQASGLADALENCRALDDDAARLACYDALVPAAGPAEEATVAQVPTEIAAVPPAQNTTVTTETPETAAALPSVPADLGAESLPRNPDNADKEKESFSATVTRCGESVDGRYLFYFDNGQVWKQSKDNRLHFRDCQFDVTITKDFFGYKMQQVGEKKRIRIRRMR